MLGNSKEETGGYGMSKQKINEDGYIVVSKLAKLFRRNLLNSNEQKQIIEYIVACLEARIYKENHVHISMFTKELKRIQKEIKYIWNK